MDKKKINTISQTSEGRYQIILDFATVEILPFLISDDYKYIWVYNHNLSNPSSWKKRKLPIIDSIPEICVRSKNVKFDFILETKKFLKILPNWGNGIQLIQMNNQPPDYFDPTRIQGEKRHQILLNECDYLFELDIPSATDYGMLVSPNKLFLESILDSENLDWNNLP